MKFCLTGRALLLAASAALCLQLPVQAETPAGDVVAPTVTSENLDSAPSGTGIDEIPAVPDAGLSDSTVAAIDSVRIEDSVSPESRQSDDASVDGLLTERSTESFPPVPGTVSTSASLLAAPSPEVAQATDLAQATPAQIAPAQGRTAPRISVNGRSYVGVGVNLGVTGDTAIGNTSFAAFSKVALTDFASVRPAILVTNAVTFLVPLTYDFPLVSAGAIRFNPYVGAGIAISTRNEAVDFLVTGGLDFPISDRLTATAAANFAPAGGLDIGLLFGIAYTFGR